MIQEEKIAAFFSNMENLNSNRIAEQLEDQRFYDDTFKTSISEPFHVVHTGTAANVINNIVKHISVANPRVLRSPKGKTEKAREGARKVGILLNSWVDALINELGEALWNAVLRGEGIFQIEFNPDAYGEQGQQYKFKGDQMPIIVTSPDPLTVFCWPYDALNPLRVAKMFDMHIGAISELYPAWSNPKQVNIHSQSGAKYRAYWDDTHRYFEADGEALGKGLHQNIQGFTPFVHFYSGWGKRAADGDPASLAVGKLRKIRHVLQEECEVTSQIDSIIGIYANPIYKITQIDRSAPALGEKELKETIIGPGSILVEPFGWKGEIYTPDVPTAALFAHLGQIQAKLATENPPILSGVPSGADASGRRTDVEFEHIQKFLQRLINNMERAIAALLGRGLQIIDTQPEALPITVRGIVSHQGKKSVKEETITKEDIDGYYDCIVELNPEEAVEDDRNFMKYRILANEGRISWKRFLMDGMKMTDDEADDVIAEALAERAVRDDPIMQSVRTQEALEQLGMQRYLRQATADNQENQRLQQGLQQAQQQGQGLARPSEARNPQALDVVRQMMESPRAPRNSAVT